MLPTGQRTEIPSTSRRRYPAAGSCIYCGTVATATERLGEEHVIPLSFGGHLVIPAASCRRCERITTVIEDRMVKGLISAARPHLQIVGRQDRRKALTRGPIYIDRGTHLETKTVPIDRHPGAMLMPILGYPSALVGAPLPNDDKPVEMRLAFRTMTADTGRRSDQLGRPSVTKGFAAIDFCRFLAKIGHSFAVAELGNGTFQSFLLNLIRGESPMWADHYVGTGIGIDPPTPLLHEINFVPTPPEIGAADLVVVRVRLFANCEMPTHYVVAGRKL